jgi:hypothetical protein
MKTFFNTINEDVSASETAFFKLLYKKNAVLAFFFNSFIKKITETAFFILFYEKMPFQHFFSIPL